jgi:hypothetical protein
MEFTKYAVFGAVPLLLLLLVTTTSAFAYWGDGFGHGWGYGGYRHYGSWGGASDSQSSYSVGYQAGQTQAQSDQSYQPYCGCPEHSWEYRNGYHQGYDVSWTQQKQTQSSEINIHGDNNIVGVNQEQASQAGSPTDENGYPSNTNGYLPLSGNPECKVLCLSVR